MEKVRQTHQEEASSQQNLISELQQKIAQFEEEQKQSQPPISSEEVEKLKSDASAKAKELEEAEKAQAALKREIEQLNVRLQEPEARISEVSSFPQCIPLTLGNYPAGCSR